MYICISDYKLSLKKKSNIAAIQQKKKPLKLNQCQKTHFCFYVFYVKIHIYHNKSWTTQDTFYCLPESYPKETEIHGYFLPGVHISRSMVYFQCVLHSDALDPLFPFLPEANGICEFFTAHCSELQYSGPFTDEWKVQSLC